MRKAHYLVLLYLLGFAPLLLAVSLSSDYDTFASFGLMNIVGLSIYTLIFSSLSNKKKSGWLAVIGIVLIVLVVVFGVSKVGQNISDRLYNRVLAPTPVDTVSQDDEILTGDDELLSGAVLTGDDETLSGDEASDTEDIEPEPVDEVEQDPFADLSDDSLLSYAQVIPYLVDTYNLSKSGTRSYNFSNIAADSPLHKPFEIAASQAMIGTSTNPDSNPSCDTYLVLKWIAAGWDVGAYTGTPQSAYRARAEQLDLVNGCAEWQFVTKGTL